MTAIAKRHAKELVTTATATTDPAFASIALQFGHQPPVLDTAYGLDRSYPAKLHPELMAQYQRVSTCWHQWLQLIDFNVKITPDKVIALAQLEPVPAKRLPWAQIPGTKKRKAAAIPNRNAQVYGSGSGNSSSIAKRLPWAQAPYTKRQKVAAISDADVRSNGSGSDNDDLGATIKAETEKWLATEAEERLDIEKELRLQAEINRLIALEIQEEKTHFVKLVLDGKVKKELHNRIEIGILEKMSVYR